MDKRNLILKSHKIIFTQFSAGNEFLIFNRF